MQATAVLFPGRAFDIGSMKLAVSYDNVSQMNAPALTPQSAAAELLRRRKVREDFLTWAKHCGFEPAAHHRLIGAKLQALSEGKIQRLMVFAPPGSAKSTFASILFPAWHLANHPQALVLGCSHTTELAKRWGRRVRNLIGDNETVLKINLSEEAAADRWRLEQGGEYKAAGVGTGIAGFRADLVILDDYLKSREDADSESVRNLHWEWYMGDVAGRARNENRWVLIQTRWHLDDLAGRLIDEMNKGGDKWEVVSIPAEAEDNDLLGRKRGDFLWADSEYGYDKFLQQQKASQPLRNWQALFQQSPTIEGGDYFKEEWLRTYEKLPARETLNVYGASDYATKQESGDFTCHIVCGLDPAGRLYVMDVYREQTTPDKWIVAFCDLVKLYNPLDWAEESGQIRASVGPFLDMMQRERKAYVNREMFPTRGDKSVRAQSIRGRMALEGLYLPAHAPWLASFKRELLDFPSGKHDDQIDALGLIGQLLDRVVRGREIKKPPVIRRDGYGDITPREDDFSIMTL